MNDKTKVVYVNDHMPPELIRRNTPSEKAHVPPTNVRPPQPTTPAPSNQGGGEK